MFSSNYSLFFFNFCRLFIIHCCYSLFHRHINCVIHYSGVFRPNHSLFIFYLYSLFIIHYSASNPDVSQCLLKSYLFKVCLFVWQVTFILNSTLQRLKKIGNVTVKNYLKESLLSLLCFIIYGQGSFEKG